MNRVKGNKILDYPFFSKTAKSAGKCAGIPA